MFLFSKVDWKITEVQYKVHYHWCLESADSYIEGSWSVDIQSLFRALLETSLLVIIQNCSDIILSFPDLVLCVQVENEIGLEKLASYLRSVVVCGGYKAAYHGSNPTTSDLRRSPDGTCLSTHGKRHLFRLGAQVWCRTKTLGRENRYVEWNGETGRGKLSGLWMYVPCRGQLQAW